MDECRANQNICTYCVTIPNGGRWLVMQNWDYKHEHEQTMHFFAPIWQNKWPIAQCLRPLNDIHKDDIYSTYSIGNSWWLALSMVGLGFRPKWILQLCWKCFYNGLHMTLECRDRYQTLAHFLGPSECRYTLKDRSNTIVSLVFIAWINELLMFFGMDTNPKE